jgi:hypothetical protein
VFHVEESEVRDLGDSVVWLGSARFRGDARCPPQAAGMGGSPGPTPELRPSSPSEGCVADDERGDLYIGESRGSLGRRPPGARLAELNNAIGSYI